MTLETRDLDYFYSQRKFVYEFTTNNNFFSRKQKLLLYCYIILVMFSFLPLRIFVFSLLRWSILDFKLERIKKKIIPKIFQSIFCRMDKWNLFLSTNVLLFDPLTILMHHFVLFFNVLSQKEKSYVKRKNNTQSSWMIFFFVFYVGWTYFLSGSLFIKVVLQWI